MADITLPEDVVVYLILIIIFETAILLSYWITARIESKKQKNLFFGFRTDDIVKLLIFVLLGIFVLYYIFFNAIPTYLAVSNYVKENGVEKSIPYMSLSMSFIALGMTLGIFVYNMITGVFSEVYIRNHFHEFNEKLRIEQTSKNDKN
jgi:hypothetical protein